MNQQAQQILRDNILGAVATVNEDGAPWVVPVHTFYDDEALYWFSHDTTAHSQNIQRHPRVSVTVWSPDESAGVKGVYINGEATKLDAEKTEAAAQLVIDRIGKLPKVFEGASAYKLPFGRLDEAKSRGECWYFYT